MLLVLLVLYARLLDTPIRGITDLSYRRGWIPG